MRLLLVEDDEMIGRSVRKGLRMEGFAVDWVKETEAARIALENEAYALLLLDLMLPGESGLELLKSLRSRGREIPTLILTARDSVSDRILGLDSGADDYLIKPFDLGELAARIRVLIRRRAGRAAPALEFGALRLDPTRHEVHLAQKRIELPAREFALLHALMERPGAVLSREQLEERLYGWGEEVESNTIEVHLHRLRRKLGADTIKNVRGVGYRLAKPQDVDP